MADVRLKAWKQRRWLIVTYGLAKLLLVPIETMANSHLFQERMWKLPQLIAIDMQLRAIYHAAFVRASLFGHRP